MVCSCSSDSERFGQLMHRLPGHSKPAQLFLPFWAELRGFGGRQMPGATGFSGCGAALAAQFGEAGHDGRDSSPCWRNLRLVLGIRRAALRRSAGAFGASVGSQRIPVPARKNDVRAAADLADLLRMGRLPEAWIAPPQTRELRELVRYRATPCPHQLGEGMTGSRTNPALPQRICAITAWRRPTTTQPRR
jgi:hypothetical protein